MRDWHRYLQNLKFVFAARGIEFQPQPIMKIQSHPRPHGFTLVELLVVIAIIAILAAAGFSAGNAAIQKAKKITTLASATAVESAVNNFYTEYGSMPLVTTGDKVVKTNAGEGVALLKVLLGNDTTENPRAIKFLNAKEGKNKKNGLSFSGETVNGLYDSWGGPFHVMMDDLSDEKITVNASGVTTVLNGRRVAVWSEGADSKDVDGTKANKSTDDVKTWGQ